MVKVSYSMYHKGREDIKPSKTQKKKEVYKPSWVITSVDPDLKKLSSNTNILKITRGEYGLQPLNIKQKRTS